MRSIIPFNTGWEFRPDDKQPFQPVTLPHNPVELPHNGFDHAEYGLISTYRKTFTLPEPLNQRRLYIDFEGAMLAATVMINEHTFPEHRGGDTPFSYDITDYVTEGENVLSVRVDSTERPDIPPFGFVVDYLAFGGIYREVSLRYVSPVHITNVFIKPHELLDKPHVQIDVHVGNQTNTAQEVVVSGGMAFWNDEFQQATVPPGATTVVTLWSDLTQMPGGALKLWTLENPHLYDFNVALHQAAGVNSPHEIELDALTVRSGLRHARFDGEHFYLNDEPVFLRGLNRHQTYPYFGAAAPARLQRKDADILKYELGCNVVRCSHYPQSRHFLDRCDEIGLLVVEEIPGWQHIGDEDWQAISLRDVEAMITRDWNHPSIILWGVRINESWDNTTFYTRTNARAHELDPTRQTIGVRFWPESELLEDVYGYNDFTDAVLEPTHTPWLITEFNGHMFPTKSFDNEARQVEHALRHTRIQDQALRMGGVSGAIGWCMFDYNTHAEFGSGDRICYHGVLDIYRLPKFAAYAYASQQPPHERIILEPATFWTMGDRSVGGNDPLHVFSNCEEIDVYANTEHIGRFTPDRENFPALPHPPFVVSGMGMRWGDAFGDLRVVGYINGEAVAERRIAGDGQPSRLELTVDDDNLMADSADMTRIVVRLVDQYGNRLPYVNRVLTFSLEGPGILIGENPFALIGGQAALYVRTTHTPGKITITAQMPRLKSQTVQITTT